MEMHIEKIPFSSTDQTMSLHASKKANYIPWIVALLFGVLWSAAYLLLGQMHGMWPMFNSEFPFSTARLFTSRIAGLRPAFGAIFAFLDGAIAGLVASWIFLLAVKIAAGIGTNHDDDNPNKF